MGTCCGEGGVNYVYRLIMLGEQWVHGGGGRGQLCVYLNCGGRKLQQ